MRPPQNTSTLSAEQKTLLISTHDVDFAYRWAERVLVFCDGRIIADGTPLSVFQNNEVVKQASLTRPIMLDVYQELVGSGLFTDSGIYPRDIREFRELVKGQKAFE